MPTPVAIVYVPAGQFDETYAYAALSYCRSRGYFPAAVIHGDWRAVDLMLTEHLAQTVVVARGEYPAAGHDGAEQMPAARHNIETYELGDQAADIRRRFERKANDGARVFAVPSRTRAHDIVDAAAERWGIDH